MGRGEHLERMVERAVELRLVATAVADEREQRRLKSVLRDLRREIGVSVPKTRAARILGVSVTALDKWIAIGRLPTVRRPGSSREEVDADALLDLAELVKRLREQGLTRSVLATALQELAKYGKPRRRLRPNMPARELRADFLSTTPADRLRTGVELSHFGSILAARGKAARLPPSMRSGSESPSRFFELLRVLCDHEVEFVVIGGLAVNLHGYERATKDVNIVPEQSEDNLSRLWAALTELRASPKELIDFRPEEMPVDFSLRGLIDGGGNWVLETTLGRVDVMQWVKGVDRYEELRAGAIREELPEIGHPIWIAGLEDLITMKQEAGRDLDLIDITALRMAHGLEE